MLSSSVKFSALSILTFLTFSVAPPISAQSELPSLPSSLDHIYNLGITTKPDTASSTRSPYTEPKVKTDFTFEPDQFKENSIPTANPKPFGTYIDHPLKLNDILITEESYESSELRSFIPNFKKEGIIQPNPEAVAYVISYLYSALESEGIPVEGLFADVIVYALDVDAGMDGAAIWSTKTDPDRATSPIKVYLNGRQGHSWNYFDLYQVTIHEFGHVVQSKYFDTDSFEVYRLLRGIPSDYSDTSRSWGHRPGEIFASDFASLFIPTGYLPPNPIEPEDSRLIPLTPELKKELKTLIVSTVKSKLLSTEEPLNLK